MTEKEAQKAVNVYAAAAMQAKEAKQILDANRDAIIRYLRKYECPAQGRFLLELCEDPKCALSWKDFAHELAEKLYGEDASRKIQHAKKKAGTKPVDRLLVHPNPRWK